MKRTWFTLAELATERLPELPNSRQGIARRVQEEGWDRSTLARPRSGRGGGLEYHYTLLSAPAQAALAARYGAANDDAGQQVQKRTKAAGVPRGFVAWAWYEGLPAALKDRAVVRLEALTRLDTLCRRVGRVAAIRAIAAENDTSVATIHNWLDRVRGVPRADWLPALVPAPRGGGGVEAEIDEQFWDAFREDYLRLSQPSLTSSFERTVRLLAKPAGWVVPNLRTLRRRVDQIPAPVRVLAREGTEALKRMYPAQERDRSCFHALQAVNVDGHKWDVFVEWEDGKISRPMMVAFQDLYSGMFLAWRMARTENKDAVRLCFGDLIETYGIPDYCWMDNGKAFASKWLTGGMPNRFRFKVKPEDPDGIMKQLGVEIHWTQPYAGQSKPIERGFGDFARNIAKHPAFEGAYTGNTPMAKPENYGSKAVPIALFTQIVNQEIAAHNARAGRESGVCRGKFSFLDVFEASYAASPIRKATVEQRRMCMLMAEGVHVDRRDGTIELLKNRYWNAQLLEHRGRKLTVRFDPENVQQDLGVYALDGTLICVAELIHAVGFADTDAARAHAAARKSFMRATKEKAQAEKVLGLKGLIALQQPPAPYQPPEAKVVRPIFGNLAVKPSAEIDEDEAFDRNFARGLRIVRDEWEDN